MLYSTYISNIKNLTEEQKKQVIIIARYFKSKDFKKDIRLCPDEDLLRAIKMDFIDFEVFEMEFKNRMKKEPMLSGLRDLYRLSKHQDVIIACYEKDHAICHRRIIGEFIASYGVKYEEL